MQNELHVSRSKEKLLQIQRKSEDHIDIADEKKQKRVEVAFPKKKLEGLPLTRLQSEFDNGQQNIERLKKWAIFKEQRTAVLSRYITIKRR